MQITDVRVRKIEKEGKMKAVVSITIDDVFVVHDIKVIEGEKGLFIAMPSRKAGVGEYRDIGHPINSATRDQIQELILKKYEEVLQEKKKTARIGSTWGLWSNPQPLSCSWKTSNEGQQVFCPSYHS